jgi:hypothetical protein
MSQIHASKITHFSGDFDSSRARSKENGARWLPNPHSCAEQLLRALAEAPDGVTPRSFYKQAWSQRLAVYVCRLRSGGWTIDTELCNASNRFEKVQHARYRLVSDTALEAHELCEWLQLAREVSR